MGERSLAFSRIAIGICVIAGIANAVQSQWLLAGLCAVLALMLGPTAAGRHG